MDRGGGAGSGRGQAALTQRVQVCEVLRSPNGPLVPYQGIPTEKRHLKRCHGVGHPAGPRGLEVNPGNLGEQVDAARRNLDLNDGAGDDKILSGHPNRSDRCAKAKQRGSLAPAPAPNAERRKPGPIGT